MMLCQSSMNLLTYLHARYPNAIRWSWLAFVVLLAACNNGNAGDSTGGGGGGGGY